MAKCFYLPAMLGLALSASSTCLGADYYFSVTGNDISGVGSIASPWQTTTKFNSIDFDPGDRAFFHAGETFNGNLYLDANDSGTNEAGQLIEPIRIGSYSSSDVNDRAIVRSPSNREAFFAYNSGGIELHDLEFVNGGTVTSNPKSGVIFQVDQNRGAGLSKYEHVRVDNIVSHGFAANGIEVYAHGSVGYQDVTISGSEFYGNLNAGVNVGANLWTQLIHQDVHVDKVVSRDNPGFSGCSPHCGQGIVLGQVDSALIENSVAHTNGEAFGKGNVGIWAWQSNEVTIQRNLAYDNLSPAGPDGGGFDIDGGMTNSVVQYNVARNNAGAGYLLAEFKSAEPMSHNVFRYNLSVNDGKDAYGPISIWGADSDDVATSAVFHNNTVILDASVAPNARGAVHFFNESHAEIDFINNVFVALNGAELVTGNTTAEKSTFVNNGYWTDGSPVQLEGTTYASIAAWAAAAGQEMLGGNFVGIEADPQFVDDAGFRLDAGSPLIDAAIDAGAAPWPAWLTSLGSEDLYGTGLPVGAGFDLGAAESLISGDFNVDGVVDAADYTAWRDGLDTFYTLADYDNWSANYGQRLAPTTSETIPEPMAVLLTLLAAASVLSRRL